MEKQLDDSQISLRIALSAAAYSVIAFFAYSIIVENLKLFSVPPFFDVLIKCLIVVASLKLSHRRVQESFSVQNWSQIPFLSTVFFYCVMLLSLYIAQILFVVFHIFVSTGVSLMSELKFILWVSSFTVSGILSAILSGHIPYLAYFFFLKYQLRSRGA